MKVSTLQVRRGGFARIVLDACAQAGLPTRALELDIPESAFLDDAPVIRERAYRIESEPPRRRRTG